MQHMHTRIFNILASLLLLTQPAFAQTAPLEQHSAPKPLPALGYLDETGTAKALDTKGAKLTVLHLWATWCLPCLAEIPEIDTLAGKYKDLRVVTVSLDKTMPPVKAFYASHSITHLPTYLDNKMAVFRALKFEGLPGTIFINDKGEEVARIDGPSEWNNPEVAAFIEKSLLPR